MCGTRPRRCFRERATPPARTAARTARQKSKHLSRGRARSRLAHGLVIADTARQAGHSRHAPGRHVGAGMAASASDSPGRRVTDSWNAQMKALGAFIRSQRKLANLSLRQLADLTTLSNPYLSQIERGLHQPSVRVLKLLSGALNVSAETLLAEAGLLEHAAGQAGQDTGGGAGSVESVIRADARLDDEQKAALLAVYRSMLRD